MEAARNRGMRQTRTFDAAIYAAARTTLERVLWCEGCDVMSSVRDVVRTPSALLTLRRAHG
jgi:hypothetical protein